MTGSPFFIDGGKRTLKNQSLPTKIKPFPYNVAPLEDAGSPPRLISQQRNKMNFVKKFSLSKRYARIGALSTIAAYVLVSPPSVFADDSTKEQTYQATRSSMTVDRTNASAERWSDVSAQSYPLKVQRRVAPNIAWKGPTEGLETEVAVRCAPSGMLLSVTITRKSGDDAWDEAALRAVQRSDPMPLDVGGVAPAEFVIRLRPSAR